MVYTKNELREIEKTVNQFNAKVRKLTSQGLKYMPKEIDVNFIKETYQYDTKALNKKLAQIKNFLKSGAEQIVTTNGGAKITAWELDVLKQEARSAKTYLTKEIKRYGDITPTVRGKLQDATYAQMGDATFENLKQLRASLNKSRFDDQQELNRYKSKIFNFQKRRITQDYVFKESYIEFVIRVGRDAGIDENLVDELVEKLEQIDAHDFYDMYQQEKAMQNIKDGYNSTKIMTHNFDEFEIKNLTEDFESLNIILDSMDGLMDVQ